MNKKGDKLIFETIIFLVLNVVFIAVMVLFVHSTGGKTFVYEKIYAKQVALLIDNARPGIEVELDISELYILAEKNKFKGNILNINSENNKVRIKLTEAGGYEYGFFSDAGVVWNLNKELGKLYFKIE